MFKKNINTQQGFTLVEIIVVSTLSSIIGIGIISSFMSGMKIWDRARNVNFTRMSAILSLEKIAKELRQSVPVESIVFEGDSESMIFPTIQADGVVQLTYEIDFFSGGLLRIEEKLSDIVIEGGFDEAVTRKVMDVDSFSLEYLYYDWQIKEYLWVEDWDEDDGVFHAVKIDFEVDDQSYSKTVYVPAAEGAADKG